MKFLHPAWVQIVRFTRILRNRCVSCGHKRQWPRPNDLYGTYPSVLQCRRCNKAEAWGRMYGAGDKKISQLQKSLSRLGQPHS